MRVAAHRLGLAAGQGAGDADLHVVVAGRQPGDTADGVALHVLLDHPVQPFEPMPVETTHALTDVIAAPI